MERFFSISCEGGVLKEALASDQSIREQIPSLEGYEDTLTFDKETSDALKAMNRLDESNTLTTQFYDEGVTDDCAAKVIWLYLTHYLFDQSTFYIGRGVRLDTSLNTALKFFVTYFEKRVSTPTETAGNGENLLFRTALNATF